MAYHVKGSGEVAVKAGKWDELDEILENHWQLLAGGISVESSTFTNDVEISEDTDTWSENNLLELLAVISPCIKAGELYYEGSDGTEWRYVYDPKTLQWQREDGEVYFNIEDMIKYLNFKGYTVTKTAKTA